jgi:3-hydroxyacyl-[acyl-carrier-protein] dehydratase
MLNHSWIIEPNHLDTRPVIADLDAIREYNPQRFEMEQLTAVIYEDTDRHVCVGYKDLAVNEFWVRCQILQSPVMPPMLMCEAAAQLANYYALRHGLYAAQGGFVGLNSVRCRRIVRPCDRLLVMVKLLKIRGSLMSCQFQCAVERRRVCDGVLIGGVFAWMKDRQRNTASATALGISGE